MAIRKGFFDCVFVPVSEGGLFGAARSVVGAVATCDSLDGAKVHASLSGCVPL